MKCKDWEYGGNFKDGIMHGLGFVEVQNGDTGLGISGGERTMGKVCMHGPGNNCRRLMKDDFGEEYEAGTESKLT
eukprot:UN12902